MNKKDQAVHQALGRVNRFGVTYAASIPAGSIAATDFARGIQLAIEIGPDDLQPGTPASAATEAKAHLFDEVWEDLKAISSTARTIGKREPGFATNFQLGDETQTAIIATATGFLEQLENPATVGKFVAYLLPAGFVTDLKADLAAINGETDEQTDDKREDAGETARIREFIKEARALIGSLNTSIRNLFRDNPEILAEWRTASRIHRVGRNGAEEIPVPVKPTP